MTRDPVVLAGTAEQVTEPDRIAGFAAAVNQKYDSAVTVEFLDPRINGTFAVRPHRVIALTGADFPAARPAGRSVRHDPGHRRDACRGAGALTLACTTCGA